MLIEILHKLELSEIGAEILTDDEILALDKEDRDVIWFNIYANYQHHTVSNIHIDKYCFQKIFDTTLENMDSMIGIKKYPRMARAIADYLIELIDSKEVSEAMDEEAELTQEGLTEQAFIESCERAEYLMER